MALPSITLVNLTAGAITLAQLNLVVPASGSISASDGNVTTEILNDLELQTQLDAGNLRVDISGGGLSSSDPNKTLEQSKSLIKPLHDLDIKHNLSGTAAPIATDDEDSGYSVGSNWADETNDNYYICVDATSTSAVWAPVNNDGVTLQIAYDGGNTIVTSGGRPFDVSGPESISLDSTSASNFTVAGGTLTLSTTGTGNTNVSSDDWAVLGNTDTSGSGAPTQGALVTSIGVSEAFPGAGFSTLPTNTDSQRVGVISGNASGTGDSGEAIFRSGFATGTGSSGNLTCESGGGFASGSAEYGSGDSFVLASGNVVLKSGNTFGTFSTGTLSLSTGNSTSGTSGVLSLSTGTATTGSTGGLSIFTGNSSTGPSSGTLSLSTGTSGGSTGFITLGTGAVTAAGVGIISGGITLSTGAASTGFDVSSGPINISTGTGSASSGGTTTGLISVATGNGLTSGTRSGNVSIGSGTATDSLTGTVTVSTGNTGTTTAASGSLTLSTGDASTGPSSEAGDLTAKTGSSFVSAGEGNETGRIFITGGPNAGTDPTGVIYITGGLNTNAGSGRGGSISITGGGATGTAAEAGLVTLAGGDAEVPGYIVLTTPATANVDGNDLIFRYSNQGTGTGGGAFGDFFIRDLAASPNGALDAQSGSLLVQVNSGATPALWLNTTTGVTSGTSWTRLSTTDDVTLQIAYNGGNTIVTSAGRPFDVSGSEVISLDATGASNFTATSGNLTLSTVTSGDLILTSSTNVDINAGTGGSITLDAPFAAISLDAISGNFTTTSGNLTLSTSATAPGNILVTGGNSSTAAGTGGAIILNAGDGFTTGVGAAITANAGDGGATGAGGGISLAAGNGGSTSGDGGPAFLVAGSVSGTTDDGGSLTLGAGNGGTVSGDGGDVNIGSGTGADSAGNITLTAPAASTGGGTDGEIRFRTNNTDATTVEGEISWTTQSSEYSGSDIRYRNKGIQTTDGSVTTILTLGSLPTNLENFKVKIYVTGIDGANNNILSREIHQTWWRNNAGAIASLTAHLDDTQSSGTVTGWAITLTNSGSNIIVQVTGAAATTINWMAWAEVQQGGMTA